MSALKDGFPGTGCDRVSHEDIDAALRACDLKLLHMFASNLLHTLERVTTIALEARALAVCLEDVTKEISE